MWLGCHNTFIIINIHNHTFICQRVQNKRENIKFKSLLLSILTLAALTNGVCVSSRGGCLYTAAKYNRSFRKDPIAREHVSVSVLGRYYIDKLQKTVNT